MNAACHLRGRTALQGAVAGAIGAAVGLSGACGARSDLEPRRVTVAPADASAPPTDAALPPPDASGPPEAAAPCTAAELASDLDVPTSLAVDDTFVYWLELGAGAGTGTLSSCAKGGCGGVPTVVASRLAGSASQSLAVDGSRLFWTESDLGLRACDKQACSPLGLIQTPVSPALAPVYLAIDTATVFLGSIQSIESCSKNGCVAPTPLAGLVTPGAEVLAVDATSVYFLDGSAVRACALPACAGGPRTLAAGLAQVPLGLAVDDAQVFFSIGGAASAPDDAGAILACPKSGCAGAPRILAAKLRHPTDLAVDATEVYWIDEGTTAATAPDGDVEACSKSGCGGVPTVIASQQPLPAAIAIDDRCVYWANDGVPFGAGRGSVRRAGK